jgi:putative transcriptional regulator
MEQTKLKVKELRDKLGITQEELAKSAGISRTTLSGIESGTIDAVSTRTLSKLSEVLKVPIKGLFL